MAVHGGDDVTSPQPRLVRRRRFLDAHHQDPGLDAEIVGQLGAELRKLRRELRRIDRFAAVSSLEEELDGRGPVRVAEVEAEQKELLKIVRRLAEEGQLVIGGGSGDDFL